MDKTKGPDKRNVDGAVKAVGNLLKLAYNFAQATDVILSVVALRVRRFGGLRQEKKKAFNNFKEAVERAAYWYGVAYDGDLADATCGDYRKLDGYRQDANELVRMMMLYIDRTTTWDTCRKVVEFLETMPEGGLFSEKDIKEFDFKAKYREEMK